MGFDPFSLGMMLAATMISVGASFLFPASGPRLKDLSVTSSAYGNGIPRVWGSMRCGGNMIWAAKIKEHKHKKKAGKGFVTQYTYTADFAIAMCYGPIQSVRRIWANGNIIYDVTSGASTDSSGGSKDVSGGFLGIFYRAAMGASNGKFNLSIYNGTEDQAADPIILSAMGGSTPAYRGIAYLVFSNFQLEDYGNQLPQIAVEVYAGGDEQPLAAAKLTDIRPYQMDNLVCDPERGYSYLFESPNIIKRLNAKEGDVDRTSAPTVPPQNMYDSGDVSHLIDVDAEGNLFVALGAQNYTQYGVVDAQSLEIISRIGYCTPYNETGKTLIPNARSGCMDQDRESCLLNGVFGELTVVHVTGGIQNAASPEVVRVPVYPGYVGYGGYYNTRQLCAAQNDGWWCFSGGDSSSTTGPSFATLNYIPTQVTGVIDSEILHHFVLNNPSPGTHAFTPAAVVVDTDGVIMFTRSNTDSYATKYSPDTRSVVWQTKCPGGFPSNWDGLRIELFQVAWTIGRKVWILNTMDGTWVNRAPDQNFYASSEYLEAEEIQYSNPGALGYPAPSDCGSGKQVYDGLSGRIIVLKAVGGDQEYILGTNEFGSAHTTLDTILRSLLSLAGLSPDDYDLSAASSVPVRGYGFASITDIKAIVGELRQLFQFDLIERDGKLAVILRGRNESLETINWRALGNSSNDNSSSVDFWKEARLSEADIPSIFSLKYMNIDADYEINTATSKRILAPIPEVFSRQQDEVSANIAFNATEAKNCANTILYTVWAERTKHVSRLPLAYAYLDPTDTITVNLADGRDYFERINSSEFGADYTLKIETRGQDSGSYVFDLTGDGGHSTRQEMVVPLPATPFILNTPYLRDIDNSNDGNVSVYYTAVGNLIPSGFNGATMFVSTDMQNYVANQIYSKDVEWGAIQGIVGKASHGDYGLDWETKIIVWPAIDAFELSPCTDDELIAGENMCVIGDEVLQFKDVTHNSNGSWTIYNLLRGRRGTEWAIDNHALNERFLVLDSATVILEQEGLDSIGKTFWFKAVGKGRSVTNAVTKSLTYKACDLMPYAPVGLSAEWSGSDIKVNFQRRTRYNGNMADGTGVVPLNEKFERYEMDIYRDDEVVRTVSVDNGATPVTNPFITYTGGDIGSDFTEQPSTLEVELFQLGIAGRGFGTKATLLVTGTASPTSRFWGASASTSLTESEILALSGHDLADDFKVSVTYDCTGGKYPYYCYPATYGTPASVKVNGLPFSAFTVTTQTVGGDSYRVIRFDNIQHGDAIPTDWL